MAGRRSLLIAGSLALMVVGLGGASSEAGARGLCAERPHVSPFEREVRDAIRDRKGFGFRHDRRYVVHVLRRYRRGFTPKERSYLRLRERIGQGIDVVRGYVAANARDVYGGVSIEDSPGRPYVLVRFTRDAALHEAELERRFPYPDNLDAIQVTYTEASLSSLVSRVVRDKGTLKRSGFHLTSGAPDIRRNRAEIRLITRRRDARAYFRRRYGAAVRVRVIARALTRLECTSPGSYRLLPDGRTLRVYWTTGPVSLVRVRVRETAREVRIGIVERWPNGAVPAIGLSRHALVRLHEPLGLRRVVGATTGLRIPRR
jgi:hypothetical protein